MAGLKGLGATEAAAAEPTRSSTQPRTGEAPGITAVVPVFNSMRYLPQTAPTLVNAASHTGNVRIVFVDNRSTDGSLAYLQSLVSEVVRVELRVGGTIASLRNWGAQLGGASAEYFAFLDADCAVPVTYFDEALDTLHRTGAAATGCEVHVPDRPHWIERTLHDLHYIGRERDVAYINSANFFVSRSAFERIGGFREDLRTGEDADVGQRLLVAGYRIHESPRVRAVHLGNPRSIAEYYRRSVWHGLGMFATVTRHRLDRPTAMLGIQILMTLASIIALVAGPVSVAARLAIAAALQLVVPAATVAYRIGQTRRMPRIHTALFLYWLYYVARAHALSLVLTSRAGRYRK